MLIRFEVANFRSVLDTVELSMVAVDRDRDGVSWAPNIGEALLPLAGVYGPNASGKSNVLAALSWLRDAVRDSLRAWDGEIPVEPFALNAVGREGPTTMTLELLVDEVRYEYVVELDSSAVAYEALFHYPERKRRRVFEREGLQLTLQRGLGAVAGTRELLTPMTLALSVARRFDEPTVTRFSDQVLHMSTLGLTGAARRQGPSELVSRRLFRSVDDPSAAHVTSGERERAVALLRLADLGIADVVVSRVPLTPTDDDQEPPVRLGRTRFLHRVDDELVPLTPAQESEGTRTWFAYVGPVLQALQRGSLLVVDELDRSLHPALSAQLLALFADRDTNPAGAQLVFTAHDTSLLAHLNRDEVWLTEKDEQGRTRLGALAEFAGERVRRSQNLERAYLGGRFGALPDLERTEFFRALGLIG